MSYFANFNPARVARALLQRIGRYGHPDRAEIATLSRALIHPDTGEISAFVGTDGLLKAGGTGNSISATQQALVTLTNAEFKAIRATPKTLVTAPGAGYVLEFIGAEIFLDYGGTAYTETADNMAIRYTDGSGTIVSEAIESTGFVDATVDQLIPVKPATSATLAKTAADNKALVLHNTGDGEFGGGNAATVIRVSIAYRIHAANW